MPDLDHIPKVVRRDISIRSSSIILFTLLGAVSMVSAGCDGSVQYDNEGPLKVILGADSCAGRAFTVWVNIDHWSLYTQVLPLPIDFRAEPGSHIIEVSCDTGAGHRRTYVMRDTVDIVSDTTIQVPCQKCL